MADSNSTILDLLLMEIGSHDNDWGTQLNTIIAAIETTTKAVRSTATTGGTTTLTKTTARERWQRITGTLASNATIEVPNVQSTWLFLNETTGAFTLTVKVNGQTGVVIPQGSSVWLRGNGTDVTPINLPQPKGRDSYAISVGGTVDAITITTVPAVITRTPGTKLSWISAGPNTITNPTINADGAGLLTIKKGVNAALVAGDTGAAGYVCHGMIAANGTDLILENPAVIVTLPGNNAFTGNNTHAGSETFNGAAIFNKAVAYGVVTLTDAATIAWDLSTGSNFQVTLGGNRVLGAFTNGTVGQKGTLRVYQDGTGGRTLDLTNAVYDFSGGLIEPISTGANEVTEYEFEVIAANTAMRLKRKWMSGRNSIGFWKEYDKGAFAVSTQYTQAHGLGRYPAFFEVYLECVTTDLSYAVGDRVRIQPHATNGSITSTLMVNATNVRLNQTFTNPGLGSNAASPIQSNVVAGSWKVIFRVYE